MRELIARTLTWVLAALAPGRPGRHSARYLDLTARPTPRPASPWSSPWLSPDKTEARSQFSDQDETTRHHRSVELERRNAAALASVGIDYPYTYAGAPFGTFDFDPMPQANA